MPGGFFRGLAKAVVDGYNEGVAKAEAQAQAQKQSNNQSVTQYASPPQSPTYLPQSAPQPGYSQQHPSLDHGASYAGYGSLQSPSQQPNGWTGQHGQHPMTPPYEHGSANYYPPPPQQQYFPISQPQQGWQNLPESLPGHSPTPAQGQPSFQQIPAQNPTSATQVNNDAGMQTNQPQLKGSDYCTGDTMDGLKYCTASVPDMDICPSCYQTHVAHTVYSTSFKQVNYPPGSEYTCDMACHAVRAAWQDAIAHATSTTDPPNPSQHSIWLQQFNQRFNEISTQVTLLVSEVQSLTQGIQLLEMQQRFQMQSAMIQITSGCSMNAIQNAQLDNGAIFTNAGSISQGVGNARFADATQMSMAIAQKKIRLQQVTAQVQMFVFGQVLK